MAQLLVAACPNCGSTVSPFARACAHCGEPHRPYPVTAIALGAVVLAIALALGSWFFLTRSGGSQSPPQVKADAPAAEPKAADTPNYDWVLQAMADCDAKAKRQSETVSFLIIPVAPTGKALPGWSPVPIDHIGQSIALLPWKDALIGLRNGAMSIYPKEVTFAVSDPATKTVYQWKPAIGVSELTAKRTGIESLTLGFQIDDIGGDIAWGPTIKLAEATCYWTNPLIISGSR